MAEQEFYRIDLVVSANGIEGTKRELRSMDRFMEAIRKRGEMLSRLKINPSAIINDKISEQVKKITGNLTKLTSRSWNVTIKAKDETMKVFDRIKNAATSLPGLIGLGAVTIGPTMVLGDSISKAMSFEAQLSSIKALTGATVEEMEQMRQLALDMGAKTEFSALEAAQGIEELLKAGLTPAQVKAGGLEAALNLATAGELALADAAEIMSTAMNAFAKDGMSAADAANILAGTANASATSVQELRYSLAMVSAVAAGVGMTFKDTNVALGLFANNGLKGSDAGTSLKTMLMNLIPQTKAQVKEFERLGLITKEGNNIFFDAKGQLKSLSDIAGILRSKFKSLTQEQRLLAFQTIFGSDAIRAANILFNEGAEGVEKFTKEMSKVTALQVAMEKMNNAAGAVEEFRGALETLQISALTPVLPLIRDFATWAGTKVTENIDNLTKKAEELTEKIRSFFTTLNADENFKNMDWGDKIVYAMDQAMIQMDAWLQGDGGKQVEKVFVKLAEIGTRAWLTTIGGLYKGALSSLGEGNIFSALGLGLGATLLGGGLLLRGGIGLGKGIYGAGKWVYGKLRPKAAASKAAETAPKTPPQPPATKAGAGRPTRARQLLQNVSSAAKQSPAATAAKQTAAKTAGVGKNVLGSLGKVAGRAVLPLAIANSIFNIATADNKLNAVAKEAGGIGGAAIGAAIGSIVPGVGTIIGGTLGYLGGRALGGTLFKSNPNATVGHPVQKKNADSLNLPLPVKFDTAQDVKVVGEFKPAEIHQHMSFSITIQNNSQNPKEVAREVASEVARELKKYAQNMPTRVNFSMS